MIEKILKIHGVGILHDAVPSAVGFARVTAIYGENGRGKSTLTDIFGSLSATSTVSLRKTLGGNNDAAIELRCGSVGYGFAGGKWNATLAGVYVFNLAFVEENVHTGQAVSVAQRGKLLDFVLGEEGVTLKGAYDGAAEKIEQNNRNITKIEDQIRPYSLPETVEEYVGYQKDPEIDAKIDEAKRRGDAAAHAAIIRTTSQLAEIVLPGLDFQKISAHLSMANADVSQAAKALAVEHFRSHLQKTAESWVEEGISLRKGELCPFCGQPLEPAKALLDSYCAYFDEGYKTLIGSLKVLREQVQTALGESAIMAFNKRISANASLYAIWRPFLSTIATEFPESPENVVADAMIALRKVIFDALDRKTANPLAAINLAPVTEAVESMAAIVAPALTAYNNHVKNLNASISELKQTASSPGPGDAKSDYDALLRKKSRWESPAIDLCNQWSGLGKTKKGLDKTKTSARQQLEEFTCKTLKQYQSKINSYLGQFCTGFKIVNVTTSNEAGRPRADYKIEIRGTHIRPSESFTNALSEGDKRSLALAFFLARLEEDSNLSDKLIVFDDPVNSLDQARRSATIEAIAEIASRVKQTIVLSHDPVFLRDTTANRKIQPLGVTVLELVRAADDFSVIRTCDIEERIQSIYKANYERVRAYAEDGDNKERLEVARAIRPLIEADLRHRFQKLLKDADTLGKMIAAIRGAKAQTPFGGIIGVLEDIESLNAFCTAFIHDGSANYSSDIPSDAELKRWATFALCFVRGVSNQ
jgi:wobble nucleotide-excising tRNase